VGQHRIQASLWWGKGPAGFGNLPLRESSRPASCSAPPLKLAGLAKKHEAIQTSSLDAMAAFQVSKAEAPCFSWRPSGWR